MSEKSTQIEEAVREYRWGDARRAIESDHAIPENCGGLNILVAQPLASTPEAAIEQTRLLAAWLSLSGSDHLYKPSGSGPHNAAPIDILNEFGTEAMRSVVFRTVESIAHGHEPDSSALFALGVSPLQSEADQQALLGALLDEATSESRRPQEAAASTEEEEEAACPAPGGMA